MRLGKGPFEGRAIRLGPLGLHHRDKMRAAQNRDGDCWDVQFSSGAGEHFGSYWSGMIKGRARVPFAVLPRGSRRLVGTTSNLDASSRDRRVKIGSTCYVPEERRGVVNPEAKLLLLAHAFDRGAHRAQFSIDSRNARSQAAVANLGAVALLRRHRITWTGHVRDTVIFSITDLDWPQVRPRLERRVLAALDSASRKADCENVAGRLPRAPKGDTGASTDKGVAGRDGQRRTTR